MTISFDNGEKRLFDMRLLLQKGTVFEPLFKAETFRRVYVDDSHCIAWDDVASLKDTEVQKAAEVVHGYVTWKSGEIDCGPAYMHGHSFAYKQIS